MFTRRNALSFHFERNVSAGSWHAQGDYDRGGSLEGQIESCRTQGLRVAWHVPTLKLGLLPEDISRNRRCEYCSQRHVGVLFHHLWANYFQPKCRLLLWGDISDPYPSHHLPRFSDGRPCQVPTSGGSFCEPGDIWCFHVFSLFGLRPFFGSLLFSVWFPLGSQRKTSQWYVAPD